LTFLNIIKTIDFFKYNKEVKYFNKLDEIESNYCLVFSNQTLEHIQDYKSALISMASLVKNSGYLYIDVPYFNFSMNNQISFEEIQQEVIRQYVKYEHFHLGFVPNCFRIF
jgi:hypothetical protein